MTATTVDAGPQVATSDEDLRHISVRAASDLLGVGPGKIRQLIEKRELQGTTIDGLLRVQVASIRAFIARGGTR